MKAKKLTFRIILIVLILLILATIIFCWPRRIHCLLGNREITSIIATTQVSSINYGTANIEVWQIDNDHTTAEITSELENIMSSCRYSPALRTLTQPNSFERNGAHSVHLILILDDGSIRSVDYMGDDLALLWLGKTPFNIILRPLDKDVCNLLSNYIIEVGQKP